MSYPYQELEPDYDRLLETCREDLSRKLELEKRVKEILALADKHHDEWTFVTSVTGVPRLWGMASFERECDSDYSRSPAQGDRWDERSVNVPRGLGPYESWAAACIAAYRLDRLDHVGSKNWTWSRACYEGELFNGFGPRARGRRTGYLWSWTNVYDGGKYVRDGVWDPEFRDPQCGMVPLMIALMKLDPTLKLADDPDFAPIWATPADGVAPVPRSLAPTEGHAHDTRWLQETLNRLGADPQLRIDGSYGRATRRAVTAFQARFAGPHGLVPDGLAGPATMAQLETAAHHLDSETLPF